MKKIVQEIRDNRSMWKKSFFVTMVITVFFFINRERFHEEFWIAILASVDFLILYLASFVAFPSKLKARDTLILTYGFLIFFFLINYFSLTVISTSS